MQILMNSPAFLTSDAAACSVARRYINRNSAGDMGSIHNRD